MTLYWAVDYQLPPDQVSCQYFINLCCVALAIISGKKKYMVYNSDPN